MKGSDITTLVVTDCPNEVGKNVSDVTMSGSGGVTHSELRKIRGGEAR